MPPNSNSASKPLHVAGQCRLDVGDSTFLGEQRIALLEQIAARGSITQAAKALKMSYKAAWDTVDAINNLAPSPLVETAAGGRGGGGTRLTDEGRRLITAYRTIAAEYQRFLDGINAAMGDPGASLALLRRLARRTSARNQLIGRIVAVNARTVDAEVLIETQGGQRITAGVTNESVEQLSLRPGRSVWALVKAVAVGITREPPPPTPGTNCLCGEVQRITRGEGSAEIVVALSAGVTLCGVIAADVLEGLAITEHDPACAVFSTAAVIVGVDD
ncbi:TOBE domain-containing protein [uncultured Thiodictyon sp.]|uniref:TOBE domain-containing protein n=1 Tax=uncultured Thiodictyon sp. TaxID=1846217 RepID=UPI0025D26F0D|nr:TOBE domain-containing protein [uncultured Thiodictyon sp.]